jgi:hypothetical protein
MSASVVEKWELNGSIPSSEILASWFSAVNPPELYRKKIIALTLAALFPDELGQAPTHIRIDDSDVRHLEAFPHPACYHSAGVYDVAAANSAFGQYFQGLEKLESLVEGPPNLLVWHMRHPLARTLVKSWYARTHVMLTRFRIQAPGAADAKRIEQIKSACRVAPEFAEMWETDPEAGLLADPRLTLLGEDGQWHEFSTRTYHLDSHHLDSHRHLSLLTIVPAGP